MGEREKEKRAPSLRGRDRGKVTQSQGKIGKGGEGGGLTVRNKAGTDKRTGTQRRKGTSPPGGGGSAFGRRLRRVRGRPEGNGEGGEERDQPGGWGLSAALTSKLEKNSGGLLREDV